MPTTNERVGIITNAFEQDGFEVIQVVVKSEKIGIKAKHKTAINYDNGKRKQVYYVEGSYRQMGYLLGLLAEPDISRMAIEFSDNIILSYLGKKDPELGEKLVKLVYELSKGMDPYIPPEFQEEIAGILLGCNEINPHTKVDKEHLVVLNMGVDILCSLIYTGDFLLQKIPEIKANDLKVPIMCNGFSVFGDLVAGNGHYFGRDFMFPDADVFQDTASLIIYRPDSDPAKPSLPLVSMTAPGMVGSVAAMNTNGVGVGVDMSPGGNCNPHQVGVNSLMLSRLSIQFGPSAEAAVNVMVNAKRGVSWDYIIADGTTDRACIVEAGCSTNNPEFLAYPPSHLKPYLPDQNFIDTHQSTPFQQGIMVRWNDYQYPADYLGFNQGLWNHYNSQHCFSKKKLYPDALTEKGYINKKFPNKKCCLFSENNCPGSAYFAPQRENNPNLVLVSNHYVIPEMRLYSMYPWTELILASQIDDIQWRYDELNNEILTALENGGQIDYAKAKQLIDFLSPYGKFPKYYANNPKSKDGKEIQIEGSTNLMDLKNKTIESHYGYYCDEWVKITLLNYIV
jgi:hypothetical protein